MAGRRQPGVRGSRLLGARVEGRGARKRTAFCSPLAPNPSSLNHPRLLQSLVRLDDALELVLGGAVAAVGVGVAAFDEFGVAGADHGRLGVVLQVEVRQRVIKAYKTLQKAGMV